MPKKIQASFTWTYFSSLMSNLNTMLGSWVSILTYRSLEEVSQYVSPTSSTHSFELIVRSSCPINNMLVNPSVKWWSPIQIQGMVLCRKCLTLRSDGAATPQIYATITYQQLKLWMWDIPTYWIKILHADSSFISLFLYMSPLMLLDTDLSLLGFFIYDDINVRGSSPHYRQPGSTMF